MGLGGFRFLVNRHSFTLGFGVTAGIDSWQRVVRPRYSYHLHDSRHLARSPSLGTGRWRFFQLFHGSRGRSVSLQIDEHLALRPLFVIFLALQPARGRFAI